jgi:putative ABC transport system ATP-binding protein
MSIVSVRNLVRHYQQGDVVVKALGGVDLDIEAGEFTAIQGPSGSGKTTLLNQIGGLDQPTSGTVTIDGVDITHLGARALSQVRLHKIGFVFQSYNLVPVLSAYENAEFVLLLQGEPAKSRRERVMKTLADVGLQGLENRRPSELSGGQQQRVAVARAIAGHPALVLADEPTANLDSKTSESLIELMRSLNRDHGITFVFSTHDPMVVEAATRVVRMRDGMVEKDERR